MGSGASAEKTYTSAEVQAAASRATEAELQEALEALPLEVRRHIAIAVAGHGGHGLGPATSSKAAPLIADGTAVQGEDEDGADAELELELSKQEALFQKCLRKRADRERQRKLEKEARKSAKKAQNDKALEAAFDGEVDALLALFDQGVEPDCADEHGNTLLSEAAAGGGEDVVEVLLGEGCDPNSVGRYRRTPLWRAAFAGNATIIRMLLRGGSDPRDCDDQAAKPIDMASNAPSKELLLCWDTSATEKIQKNAVKKRAANAKKADQEEKEKEQRQEDELMQAIDEATRKKQIARSELARTKKLLRDYRAQKISWAEQGMADKIAELEPLLEGAEAQMKLYEAVVQEWEWKISRAQLKQNDFKQAQKDNDDKKKGTVQGFTLQIELRSAEERDTLLSHLTAEVDVSENFEWEGGLELTKGDTLVKDGPFSHLRQSEFKKKALSDYGMAPPTTPEEADAEESTEKEADEGKKTKEDIPPFPLRLTFTRGFSRTIGIKSVADVLMKDVGGLRAADGRWPLVIDPSGRTSTFIQYTGAAVFSQVELNDMDPTRVKKALLKGLLNGGCLFIDLGDFNYDSDVIEETWSKLEKGLFKKLVDRSVMYSYLLPRRFRSLITKDVQSDFVEGAFMDSNIHKFVLGFVTSVRNPDFGFAKQFYTVSVRQDDADEETA